MFCEITHQEVEPIVNGRDGTLQCPACGALLDEETLEMED
jgi:hypothetical protein